MTFYLPDLLGKPEDDALVQAFIAHYQLIDYEMTEASKQSRREHFPDETPEDDQKICKERAQRYTDYVSDTETFDISLKIEVDGYSEFSRYPKVLKGPPRVKALTVRAGYPGPMPFGLRQDADLRAFSVGRLKSKQSCEDCTIKQFLHEERPIILGYTTANGRFEFLHLGTYSASELAQMRFVQGVKAQKPQLVAAVEGQMVHWRQQSPVHLWRQRMAEGDSLFSEENLALSQAEIEAFIEAVAQALAKKSPTQIVNALKKTVQRFNRLTQKHGHFIETNEREELAAYLQDTVAQTGLTWEPGFDITAPWRLW